MANEGDLYRVLVESRTHDAVAHTRRVRIASCFTVWPIVWLMVLIPEPKVRIASPRALCGLW